MSTYVVSDLHGQYKMFEKLLEKVVFSDADKLYMLGDAIDRGPDGIKILQKVMDSPNMEFLLGNHEVMMLNTVNPDGSIPFAALLTGRDAERWLYRNGGDKTYSNYKHLDKESRLKLLDWLNTRPLTTKIEVNGVTYILTHSFFDMDNIDVPYKEMDYQTVWDIVWQSPFRWDLYVDIKKYKEYEPWIFVIGHVPSCHADGKEGLSPLSTYKEDNIIDIDGGCAGHDSGDAAYKGGILLRLDDLEEFSISFEELSNK